MTSQPFDSIEAAFESMRQAEEAANATVTPTQRAISYGAKVVKPQPHLGVVVFGSIWTKEERDEGEERSTIAALDDAYGRGYRTGRWYSDYVPEGEVGDSHIASLWPIEEEEWEEADALGFSTRLILSLPWGREMMARVLTEAGKEMGPTVAQEGAGFVVVESTTEDLP